MVKLSSNPTSPETPFSPLELLKLGCSSEALHHDLATKFFSAEFPGSQGATLTAKEFCWGKSYGHSTAELLVSQKHLSCWSSWLIRVTNLRATKDDRVLNMLRAIKLSRLQGEHKSKTMVKPSSNPTPPETPFSPLELLKLGCSSEALHHDLATKFFSAEFPGSQGATLTAKEFCWGKSYGHSTAELLVSQKHLSCWSSWLIRVTNLRATKDDRVLNMLRAIKLSRLGRVRRMIPYWAIIAEELKLGCRILLNGLNHVCMYVCM